MKIINLQLTTSNVDRQREFYTRVFGFPVLRATPDLVELEVGESRLSFAARPPALVGPYHVAFNIPQNQFAEATRWLQEHVSLIPDATGVTIFHVQNWDADNVYFYDPAGNIVELIARHTLPSTSERPFSGASILGISEIGIVTDDVLAQVAAIMERSGASVYRGPGSTTFTPVGDEHGLFIVVKRGRIWFPDTGKAAEPLPITVTTHMGTEPMTWEFS